MRSATGEAGQMSVELAIVLPIIVAVMVIALDCMVYLAECSRFDHVAAQCVLAQAVSPGRESYDSKARVQAVQEALAPQFSDHGEFVSVSCSDAGVVLASMSVYELKLEFPPWPFSSGSLSAFGYTLPLTFEHTCKLAVDPYTPGELL